MKVGVYQTSPVFLDVKANIEQVKEKIARGREREIKLCVFPELALTGYFVGARYPEVALRMDSREIRHLVDATKGTAAVVGFIEESPSMNFYNSALLAVDGELRFACRKLNLPNYGVFEERKYFSPGKKVRVERLGRFNLAIFICNDMWHPSLPYLAVCQKADIFVTVFNSSQGSMGDAFSNIESWEIINKFYSRVFGVYNICANRVGEENLREIFSEPGLPPTQRKTGTINNCEALDRTYRFWGGSEIVNPFGQAVATARKYEEDEIFAEIDFDLLRQKKILLPYLRNDDPYFTHRELDRILYGNPGKP